MPLAVIIHITKSFENECFIIKSAPFCNLHGAILMRNCIQTIWVIYLNILCIKMILLMKMISKLKMILKLKMHLPQYTYYNPVRRFHPENKKEQVNQNLRIISNF